MSIEKKSGYFERITMLFGGSGKVKHNGIKKIMDDHTYKLA